MVTSRQSHRQGLPEPGATEGVNEWSAHMRLSRGDAVGVGVALLWRRGTVSADRRRQRIADPDVVNVGQRLIMPDFTRYTVVAGDTLSALAARFYGDASLYPLIAAVNGIADPGVIDVGQVLVIFIGRSDGFGLRIVDRNENDPRLWYYRFQTSAIGWNPGVNVLLPDDYRTSGRTYPSSTCSTAAAPTRISARSTFWASAT